MRVLVLSGTKIVEKEIENTLEALQKEVGGIIEIPYICEELTNAKIDLIINEEGKLIEGLEPEIAVINVTNCNYELLDIIMGNCVFASHDDHGNTIGLSDDQVKIVHNILRNLNYLGYRGKHYIVRSILI